MIRAHRLLVLSLAIFVFQSKSSAAETEFVEPGRFGVEFNMTTGNMQFGGTYAAETWEAALDYNSQLNISGSNTAAHGDSSSGLEGRAGKRFNIGAQNHLSLGLDASTSYGSSGGVSTSGSYTVGPYVGLQRNFAGSAIMLFAYILPVEFSHSVGNDGNGNSVTLNSLLLFQEGGVGFAYLF
jgi:hypothetical protein